MAGFIFGGNTDMTYEELQRKRQSADAMASQIGTPRNVGEGLTAIGKALAARGMRKQADKRHGELKGEFDDQWSGIFGGGQVGAAPAAAGPSQGIANDTMTALGKQPQGQGRDSFIQSMMPHALRVSEQTGLDPRLVIAQAAQETGWGKSAPGNNFFGIKSHGKEGGNTLATREVLNGQDVTVNDSFRAYQGMGDSADGYASFLQENPRYGEMLAAGDLDGQIAALGQSGYATDPNYASSVGSIARSIQMPSGGQGGGVGGSGMTIQALAEVAGNPMASPGQKAVVNALLQQKMQANDPNAQLDLQLKQAQLGNLQNPPTKRTSSMQEYEFAKSQGFEGSFTDYKTQLANASKSTTNVTVGADGGPPIPAYNKLPAGYVYKRDESGQVVIDQNGVPTAVPVTGGPEDTTKNDAVAQESKERAGNIVTEDISRSLDIIEGSPGWTTGIGSFLAGAPGTKAKSLSGLLQTIKANVGFDRLQQMRDASKTGGALGAINKSEMDLLQSVLGNLDQSLSAEDLTANLERVNGIYMDIIHGKGEWKSPSGGVPEGIDAGDWDFMTDEEKALFQ